MTWDIGVPGGGAAVGTGGVVVVGVGLALDGCAELVGTDNRSCDVDVLSPPPPVEHAASSADAAMITAIRIPSG
jgi:hypothetical protein